MAFSCMTTDIVTEYAFTRSYSFLDSESFEPNFHKAIAAATETGPVVKHCPWMLTVLLAIPESVMSILDRSCGNQSLALMLRLTW